MAKLILRLALILSSLSLTALALIRLIDIPQGNAARGEVLYFGASSPYLPCFQCHGESNIAPGMHDLVARVRQDRLTAPENAGETVIEYLAESVIDPPRYLVPSYKDLMPAFWSTRITGYHSITLVDLQDIVAYLMTL